MGVDLSLLEHVSPIEWDNVVFYGQYVLNRNLIKRRRAVYPINGDRAAVQEYRAFAERMDPYLNHRPDQVAIGTVRIDRLDKKFCQGAGIIAGRGTGSPERGRRALRSYRL